MFQKYCSIKNHYDKGFINKAVKAIPSILAEKYYVQEKIDGANFSAFIYDNKVRYAKRTSFLAEDESFYGWQQVVQDMGLQPRMAQIVENCILRGELFGEGIQSRINYGSKKRILFYEVTIDGKVLNLEEMNRFIEKYDLTDLFVKVLDKDLTLDEALSFSNDFFTTYNPLDGNICEGIVIRPQNTIIYVGESRFIIKSKNDKFTEKMKVKNKKVFKEIPPLESFWRNEYHAYFTENRMLSVFSKHGEISDTTQLGDYIKYFVSDAREDFLSDNLEELQSVGANIGVILHPGKVPAQLLTGFLKNND